MTYFPIPDDEQLYVDKSMSDRQVLTGLYVVLDSKLENQGHVLVVRATTVRIHGPVRLPGGDIEVFARKIIARDDATLDVSGAKGSPDYTGNAPALSGTAPGQSGKPGANGGDGGHGGRIALFAEEVCGNLALFAGGGAGGGAQSGGNGTNGAKGANSVGCGGAQPGRPGGAAGRAGKPGRGGNGGEIEVVVLTDLTEEQIRTDVAGGRPGQPGKHGSPGIGGPGGDGGSEGHFVHEPCVV